MSCNNSSSVGEEVPMQNEGHFLDKDFKTVLSDKGVKVGMPVYLRIIKEKKRLEVWMENDKNEWIHAIDYPICYFSGGLGHKNKEGDRKSPEGFYYIKKSSLNPNSSYHLAMNIGYPNQYDLAHGKTGSYIMIHGNCVSIGCYAMTDSKIEEIYELVEEALNHGQGIVRCHIFPFEMTEENLLSNKEDANYEFWLNIKEGYDFFEANKRPPNVEVQDLRYIFE